MKNALLEALRLIGYFVGAACGLIVVLAAANASRPETTTTEWVGHTGSDRVEVGLRSDGVVVWRKVTSE